MNSPGAKRSPVAALWVRWRLKLVLCLSAVAITAAVLGYLWGSLSRDRQNRVLVLGNEDIDPETTVTSRALLKQNLLNSQVALRLLSEARNTFTGPVLAHCERSLRNGRIDPSLEPLARKLEQNLDIGQAAAFTFWIQPNDQATPGTIDLQIDGIDLGPFVLGSERSPVTIISRTNETSRLRITSLGPARVLVRAETATSEAATRSLCPGEQYWWDIVIQGGQ
jgi:hypothetical protein